MGGLQGDVLAGRLEEEAQVLLANPPSPGVAGPPVAPQASDLVTKFQMMLQKPKAQKIVDEGNMDIVEPKKSKDIAASSKSTKSKVNKKPAGALVAGPQKLVAGPPADALVAGPPKLVAGPQKLVAVPQKRDAADFELPSGWTRRKVQRTSGKSAGKWDTYFYNPAGDRFRTQGEVMKEIA